MAIKASYHLWSHRYTSGGYLIVKLPLSSKFAVVWSLRSGLPPTLDVSIPDAVDKGAWMTDGLEALFPSGNAGSSWHSRHSGRTHKRADTGSIWSNQCEERGQTLLGQRFKTPSAARHLGIKLAIKRYLSVSYFWSPNLHFCTVRLLSE